MGQTATEPDESHDERAGAEYFEDTPAATALDELEHELRKLKQRRANLLKLLNLAHTVDCNEGGFSFTGPDPLKGHAGVASISGAIERLIQSANTSHVQIEWDSGDGLYKVSLTFKP